MSDIGEEIPQTPVKVPESSLTADVSEFPIPVRAFTNSLARTEDEVWVRLLQLDYKGQAHKPSEWRDILASLKQREV